MSEQQVLEKASSEKAMISLVLGILGMIAWIIPIIGLPVQIVGLVFGIKTWGSSKKSVVGVVLCIIGLVLSVGNAAIGAYMAVKGQYPIVKELAE